MDELFAAIRLLWNANATLSGKFQNLPMVSEVPELTGLPNVCINPVDEAKKTKTNIRLYEDFTFEFKITHNNWELFSQCVKLQKSVIRYASLNSYLTANKSVYTLAVIQPPRTTYTWEARFLRVLVNTRLLCRV